MEIYDVTFSLKLIYDEKFGNSLIDIYLKWQYVVLRDRKKVKNHALTYIVSKEDEQNHDGE